MNILMKRWYQNKAFTLTRYKIQSPLEVEFRYRRQEIFLMPKKKHADIYIYAFN